jgi:hypothetical protein
MLVNALRRWVLLRLNLRLQKLPPRRQLPLSRLLSLCFAISAALCCAWRRFDLLLEL